MDKTQRKADRYYMRKCFALAYSVKGLTSPNPSVGAIIVKDKTIIGQGATNHAGGDHAEVIAIKQAGEKARGATLYVSLEPCCFYGKTPPCTQRIIESGLSRVVVSTLDPNPKVNGKGIEILNNHGIQTDVGIYKQKGEEINEDFFVYITQHRPYVIAKYAMTLDGKIATSTGNSQWISNDKAREEVHRLRSYYDSILVGAGTVIKDNPKLTVRYNKPEYSKLRIIIDQQGIINDQYLIMNDAYPALFCVSEKHFTKKYKDTCEKNNKEILLFSGQSLDLDILLNHLYQKDIVSILVEGGARIHHSFITQNKVNKMVVYVSPKLTLGNDGLSPFFGKGVTTIADAPVLKRVRMKRIRDNVRITGYF